VTLTSSSRSADGIGPGATHDELEFLRREVAGLRTAWTSRACVGPAVEDGAEEGHSRAVPASALGGCPEGLLDRGLEAPGEEHHGRHALAVDRVDDPVGGGGRQSHRLVQQQVPARRGGPGRQLGLHVRRESDGDGGHDRE
jgi:hypothetical protein